MKVLDAIPQRRLEDEAVKRLREALLEGMFEPGGQLNQVQLALQLGASRGTIRVALRRLEEEGLVYTVPYRGTFVTRLNRQAVKELYELRSVLEAYGIRLAISHCTPDDVARLRTIVAKMLQTVTRGDVMKLVRQEFEFHRLLLELSGNTLLLQTWSSLRVQIQRVLSFRIHGYHNLEEIAASHLPLLDALERQDAEEAAKAIVAHVDQALDDLMARWPVEDQ